MPDSASLLHADDSEYARCKCDDTEVCPHLRAQYLAAAISFFEILAHLVAGPQISAWSRFALAAASSRRKLT
jgi:hypothetical protein